MRLQLLVLCAMVLVAAASNGYEQSKAAFEARKRERLDCSTLWCRKRTDRALAHAVDQVMRAGRAMRDALHKKAGECETEACRTEAMERVQAHCKNFVHAQHTELTWVRDHCSNSECTSMAQAKLETLSVKKCVGDEPPLKVTTEATTATKKAATSAPKKEGKEDKQAECERKEHEAWREEFRLRAKEHEEMVELDRRGSKCISHSCTSSVEKEHKELSEKIALKREKRRHRLRAMSCSTSSSEARKAAEEKARKEEEALAAKKESGKEAKKPQKKEEEKKKKDKKDGKGKKEEKGKKLPPKEDWAAETPAELKGKKAEKKEPKNDEPVKRTVVVDEADEPMTHKPLNPNLAAKESDASQADKPDKKAKKEAEKKEKKEKKEAKKHDKNKVKEGEEKKKAKEEKKKIVVVDESKERQPPVDPSLAAPETDASQADKADDKSKSDLSKSNVKTTVVEDSGASSPQEEQAAKKFAELGVSDIDASEADKDETTEPSDLTPDFVEPAGYETASSKGGAPKDTGLLKYALGDTDASAGDAEDTTFNDLETVAPQQYEEAPAKKSSADSDDEIQTTQDLLEGTLPPVDPSSCAGQSASLNMEMEELYQKMSSCPDNDDICREPYHQQIADIRNDLRHLGDCADDNGSDPMRFHLGVSSRHEDDVNEAVNHVPVLATDKEDGQKKTESKDKKAPADSDESSDVIQSLPERIDELKATIKERYDDITMCRNKACRHRMLKDVLRMQKKLRKLERKRKVHAREQLSIEIQDRKSAPGYAKRQAALVKLNKELKHHYAIMVRCGDSSCRAAVMKKIAAVHAEIKKVEAEARAAVGKSGKNEGKEKGGKAYNHEEDFVKSAKAVRHAYAARSKRYLKLLHHVMAHCRSRECRKAVLKHYRGDLESRLMALFRQLTDMTQAKVSSDIKACETRDWTPTQKEACIKSVRLWEAKRMGALKARQLKLDKRREKRMCALTVNPEKCRESVEAEYKKDVEQMDKTTAAAHAAHMEAVRKARSGLAAPAASVTLALLAFAIAMAAML